MYHFATGRWYCGQTITRIWERGQGHWYDRLCQGDALHEVLAMEDNPFSFTMVPLEWVQPEEYKSNSGRRGEWRQRFRWAATPRERFWIEEEETLWLLGWNS